MPSQSTSRTHPRPRLAAPLLLALGLALTAPAGAADAPVSFRRDVAPILLKKCQTCHNEEKPKGRYRLDTFELLLKPGASKEPSVVAGHPEAGELLRLLKATDPDDRMPQKDEPLPAAQIALIERWVKEGAKFDGPDPKAPLASVVPKVAHPEPPAKYQHPLPITALAFHPHGTELAVSGYHEVTIWNPETGALLRRIKKLPRQIRGLAYAPDGNRLAVAGGTPGESGELDLVDLKHRDAVTELGGMTEVMLAVAFTPDGQRVVTGGGDNAIHVFQLATGRKERTIQQHADWVMALAVNSDGSRIASASRDRTARTFNLQTGELEENYAGHDAALFAVAFSADGKTVYSAGRDRTIDAWASKDAKKAGDMKGFEADIFQLLVVEQALFSCSADKRVRQHSTADRSLVRTLPEHGDWVYALAAHPGSRRLATGSYNGEVRVFQIEDGKPLLSFVAVPGRAKAD